MIKYKSIVEKLTLRQKVAVLTDIKSLSDADINRAGVPKVKTEYLSKLNENNTVYPTYESAVCSWDTDLIGLMTEDLAVQARGRGINLLLTPDLKCAANAYKQGLSEDAYLCGAMGGAISAAIRASGAASCLSRFYLNDDDIEYLDICENARAIHDLFIKPFMYAVGDSPCDAVLSSLSRIDSGYSETNTALFGDAVNGLVGKNVFVISESTASDVDFHTYLSGCVCIGGYGLVLDRAIGRYKRLLKYREEGSATESEFQGALNDGSAIAESNLDEAVDRVIDFAFRINQAVPSSKKYISAEEIGLKIAEESFVLLKNEDLLPLAHETKIAVIGEPYDGFSELSSPLKIVGSALGYDRNTDRSELLITEALRATKQADVILLFLRDGELCSTKKSELRLPANRIALIDALKRTGKRMIAVLVGSLPADMTFDSVFSSVILAPTDSRCCAQALINILSGEVSPSGRLARTCYDNADEYFSVLKEDKEKGKTLVGSFVGYRYYDAIGRKVRYPFGFGLSYTTFEYSGLQINGDEVSFTVKNIGKMAGCETAQIYVGKHSKSYISPKKELKAFIRIPLEAGEFRRVTVNLPYTRFASFDERINGENVEEGNYAVYVGASVQDVRLKGTRYLEGEHRAKCEDRSCNYFRDLSNIGRRHRMGTAAGKSLPAQNKLLCGIAYGVLLAALLSAVIACFVLLGATPSLGKWLFFGISLLIAVGAVGLLIGEKSHRKKLLKREVSQQHLNFEDADANAESYEDIFNEVEKLTETKQFTETASMDEPHYYDNELTFAKLFGDLKIFFRERGLYIGDNDLLNIISSLTATHMLIISADAAKQINRFSEILCEYLGTGLYADDAEGYNDKENLFNRWNEHGKNKTELCHAFEAAEKERPYLHVALLRHFKTSALKDVFSSVKIQAEQSSDSRSGEANTISIPPNLWVIIALEREEGFNNIPPEVAEVSAVLSPVFRECDESAEKTRVKPLGYYQFTAMRRNVREIYPLDERLWKRVDRLEEKLNVKEYYRIGNRLWMKMERHTSAYMACGGTAVNALDSAVATELLPRVISQLIAVSGENEYLSVLEEIFGSEDISYCRKICELIGKQLSIKK